MMTVQDPPLIEQDMVRQRFTMQVGAHLCVLDYRIADGRMTITHTGVPVAVGGRGIAAALTLAAFEFARQQRLKVVPACSYAASWVQRHPQWLEWVAL
jgi:uncharacterized protein